MGRPERSARDPQTPKKPTRRETNGKDRGGKRKTTLPVIVTVDGEGHERELVPLSRNAAWRAGRFWEDGNGAVKVFLAKGETRKEVDVENASMTVARGSGFSTNPQRPKKPKKEKRTTTRPRKRRLPCSRTPRREEDHAEDGIGRTDHHSREGKRGVEKS